MIALPILVFPQKADHLPVWKLLAIGALIGPGVMIAVGIYFGVSSGMNFDYKAESYGLLGIATLFSFIATTFYVIGLKLFSERHPQKA